MDGFIVKEGMGIGGNIFAKGGFFREGKGGMTR